MVRDVWKIFLAILLLAAPLGTMAQEPLARTEEKTGEPAGSVPKEESSVTEHTLRIGNQTIPYRATAGTILLKNPKGEPTALVFSTSYARTDVTALDKRPLVFLFNGGPGASSIWLHMGVFGPRRVVTRDADFTPPAPYELVDNASTLLDTADLVFVDPVGTGFSHAVGKSQNKDFYGVDPDVQSLGQFVSTYVSRNNRWNSPKFLIGESYGTFRAAVLGNYLQSEYGMYLNGVVLISSLWQFGSQGDLQYVSALPTFAATAWYHRLLDHRPAELTPFLDQVRRFAETEYASALMKGSRLDTATRSELARKLSEYTGLSEAYLLKANLRVNSGQFFAELQRSRGLNTGRFDTRVSGLNQNLLGEYPSSDPSFDSVLGPFTAAFNAYVRTTLKFGQDMTYHTFSSGSDGGSWDFKHDGNSSPNAGKDLAEAILANPLLQVQVECGFYDLATPFFSAEYAVDHLDLPAPLRPNIHLDYYEAGHMMYLHPADLVKLKQNVGAFIERAAH
jgi:carboxypeptidase C (cathepsin A)